MALSSHRLASLALLALIGLGPACVFDPAYLQSPCDQGQPCPDGTACWEAGGICLPTCGEQDAPNCPGTDTDAGVDGGEVIASDLLIGTRGPLADGVLGQAYEERLYVLGGTPPYLVSLPPSNALPRGLDLTSDGTVSGTPNASGTHTFEIAVTDSASPPVTRTRELELRVVASSLLLEIRTRSLADGRVGVAYAQELRCGGGSGPYEWRVLAGELPPGLTIARSSGLISGTPTSAGTFPITVEAKDQGIGTKTVELSVEILPVP